MIKKLLGLLLIICMLLSLYLVIPVQASPTDLLVNEVQTTTSTVPVTSLDDLQSAHPYQNNLDTTWEFTLPGDNDAIYVTFSTNTQTEEDFDFIQISDGNNNVIASFSGWELTGKTVPIQGSTVKIRLTSDGSGVYYGFTVNSVVPGIWNGSLQPEGEGTQTSPFLIAEKGHLCWMAAYNSIYDGYIGKYFKQVADIDISSTNNWIPIGNTPIPFQGTYDGSDYTISGLKYHGASSNVGLFGYTYLANIRNTGVINVDINSSGHSIGSLIGTKEYGTLIDSFSTGVVRGGYDTGGLVGVHYKNTIANCYSTTIVSGTNAGGLVGSNDGSIINDYSMGMVDGSNYVGGLVGINFGTIRNSYSTNSVSTGADLCSLGGLVGINCGTMTNSYSTGTVTGNERIGGLIGGWDSGSINNCFYVDEHGTNGIGYTKLTTTPITTRQPLISFYKSLSTYTNTTFWTTTYPWNFSYTWTIDDAGVVNDGYPYLIYNRPYQPTPASYNVTFDSMGGSGVNSITAAYNTGLEEPPAPTKAGFLFGGWYKEEGCINKWDFNADVVLLDTVLYAKWLIASNITVSSATAAIGDTVEITVSIDANTQIATGSFVMNYDADKLTPINYKLGSVIEPFSPMVNLNYSDPTTNIKQVKVSWMGITPLSSGGDLLQVSFKINDSVVNRTVMPLTISNMILVNANAEPVVYNIANGSITAVKVLLGDSTNDGKVNILDAFRILRCDAGFITLTDEQKINADIDNNGVIDIFDAMAIQKYDLGLINELK